MAIGTGTSFFGAKKNFSPTTRKKLVCVDVGGAGDCGFRSAAAAMLDNVLCKPLANEELAKKLLELHKAYFLQQPVIKDSTSAQSLAKRVEAPGARAEFISKLAFTLRQVAVDELLAHPEHYRGAFVGNGSDEGTSPEKMRLQETWIDESYIAALSNAMQTPIEVRVVAPGKELPLRLNYNAAIKEPVASVIVLQLQDKHYMPQVNNPEYFKELPRQMIDTVKPNAIVPKKKDRELSEILEKIADEDNRLHDEFEDNKKCLTAMVKAGEMTKETLLDIYISGMTNSDYLEGRIKQVGLEHGNQQFFEAIKNAQKGVQIISSPQEKNYDDEVTMELVHAIARAVSIGQLDSRLVYDEENVSFGL